MFGVKTQYVRVYLRIKYRYPNKNEKILHVKKVASKFYFSFERFTDSIYVLNNNIIHMSATTSRNPIFGHFME